MISCVVYVCVGVHVPVFVFVGTLCCVARAPMLMSVNSCVDALIEVGIVLDSGADECLSLSLCPSLFPSTHARTQIRIDQRPRHRAGAAGRTAHRRVRQIGRARRDRRGRVCGL